MPTTWFNVAVGMLATGDLDLEADDIRVILLEVDDEGNLTTQRSRATVAAILATDATELSSTNYAREALTSKSVTVDGTNDVIDWEADDVTWSDPNMVQDDEEVAVAAITYLHVDGDDSNNIPITRHTGGFPQTPNGEPFHLRWDSGVVARLRHPSA